MNLILLLSFLSLFTSCEWLVGDIDPNIQVHYAYQEAENADDPHSRQIVIKGKALKSIEEVSVAQQKCTLLSKKENEIKCRSPHLPRGWYGLNLKSITNKKFSINNAYVAGVDVVGAQRLQEASGASTLSGATLSFLFKKNGEFLTFDDLNRRVMVWNQFPTSWNTPANKVLFRPNNRTSENYTYVREKWFPERSTGMCEFKDKVIIADEINHRLLVYDGTPSTWNQRPQFVLGQRNDTESVLYDPPSASSLRAPKEMWCNEQYLIVADSENHRIMVWNKEITQNFQMADVVIGQADFISNSINRGESTASEYSLHTPITPYLDEANDRLFIADTHNYRILIFNNFSLKTTGAAADFVIGQDDFVANAKGLLNRPRGMDIYQNQLISISQDYQSIIFFDLSDLETGLNYKQPYRRLGTGAISIGNNAFNWGHILKVFNNKLIFSDFRNNRLLIWSDLNQLITKNTDFTYNAPEQNIPADDIRFQPNFNSISTISEKHTNTELYNLFAMTRDGENLVLASTSGNIVTLEDFKNGDKEFNKNLVWPDFLDTTQGIGPYLNKGIRSLKHFKNPDQTFAVDTNNYRVLIYNGGISNPTSVHVLGQNRLDLSSWRATTVANSPRSFNNPADVCRTEDFIFVSDKSNHRVLAFSTNLVVDETNPDAPVFNNSALFVIGQPDLTTRTLRATSNKDLNSPHGIWCDENKLLVADSANHRILEFSPLPQGNYPQASRVLGQINFTENNEGPILKNPSYISSNGNNLITSIPDHHKVLYWKNWPQDSLAKADYVFGQREENQIEAYCGTKSQMVDINCFHTPRQVDQDEKNIYIVDGLGHRLLLFPHFKN